MKYLAYAKINIRLNVLGKKENNYHDLYMLNAKTTLCDEIEIIKSDVNKVKYSIEKLNNLENDLCLNVLNEMKIKYSITDNYYIYIKKNIPMGAGLGGGSSDVACIINAIDEINNLNLSLEEKISIGLKYGADVPYCLINEPAIVEGIGEKITILNQSLKQNIIIVYPNIHVSTKEVFEKVINYSNSLDLETVKKYIYNNEYDKLLVNDLEEPSFKLNKELKQIKDVLVKYCPTIMSGSGSSMLMFTNDENIFFEVKKVFPNYEIFKAEII